MQIDVKFIAPIPGVTAKKYYQFTAIDDCTRIRVLRVYPKCNQKTAVQFLDYLLERLPFRVEAIQTDNGAESPVGLPLARLGPGHLPRLHQARDAEAERQSREIAPHRPRGVLCRMLDGVVIDDTDLFNDKLQQWEDNLQLRPPPRRPGRPDPL